MQTLTLGTDRNNQSVAKSNMTNWRKKQTGTKQTLALWNNQDNKRVSKTNTIQAVKLTLAADNIDN